MKNQISLNGKWNYLTDEEEKLSFDEAIKKYKNKKLPLVNIPSNWQLEGLNNFSGAVWFFKEFSLPKKNNNNLFILQFNGIDYFADVWLNSSYLGHHEGYFQKFYFDASESISEKNFLIIKVSSPKEEPGKVWPYNKKLIKGIFNHHDCRPGGWSLKYGQDQNTGGIWNDVSLILNKDVFVEEINISSKINFENDSALLKISVYYFKKISSLITDEIEINIISPSKKKFSFKKQLQLIHTKNKLDIILEIDKPELWWSWDTGEPNLYEMSISGNHINVDKKFFGIREVRLNKKKEFYLNNKKLFLRGTNVIPTQFLSDLDNKKIEEQIFLMKDANINIVRIHAHINRKEYYDECDRQGILVWQDFPLQWTYDNSASFISNAVSQIKDMVVQLYNHPSIVFWCCHNEPGDQIKSLDPFLYDAVLSVDTTRIVRLASNYEEHAYDGWYWGKMEHYAAKPMGPLVTEFGAQALPEINSLKKFIPGKDINHPERESWAYHNFQFEQTFNITEIDRGKNIEEFIRNSQQYQANLLQTAIDFYRRGKNKDITGIFQFMFIDCWPSITWSVVDYYGKKKPGYYILKKSYQPLYISLGVRQRKYSRSAVKEGNKKLNIDIWVINDYQHLFKDCKIIFSTGKRKIGEIEINIIPEDSIQYLSWEKTNIILPDLKPGGHKIEARLMKEDSVLSYNDFMIEVN